MASAVDIPTLHHLIAVVQPLGTLWVNALQMTAIPLVLSLLVGSVVSAAERGRFGRIAGPALLMFLLLYLTVAASTALVTPPLLSWLDIQPATLASSQGRGTVDPARDVPVSSFGEQLSRVIPVNPFRAAADGDILPLFVFFVLFALALSRIDAGARGSVVSLFKGAADAMLVLVGWLLVVAPFGVFAVAAPLGARLGFGAFGALAYYVVLLSGLCVLFTVPLYALVSWFGHVSVWRFAQGTAPSQAVAFSTQSSLASLPTMIEGAERQLGAVPQVVGVVLPLAVSVFRFTTPIWLVFAALFVARLYGIHLGSSQMIMLVAVSILASVGGVGLPSGASFFAPITPVFLAVGLPTEAIPVLFAVDTIPDMIETVGNVTADMATAAIISRRSINADRSLAE